MRCHKLKCIDREPPFGSEIEKEVPMENKDQITPNFKYSEFTRSRIAEGMHIDNSIPSEYV